MKTALEAYGEKLTNKKFFQDFVTTTINSNLTGINSFLDGVSEYYKLKTDPNSAESYINKPAYENQEVDIKKTTYYNIKSLYDRVGGGSRSKGSVPIHAVSKVKDLNTLEFENLKDISLFYNSILTDDECFSGIKQKTYDLYQIFSVVDRGNNDIGTKVLANLSYIYNNYYTDFKAVPAGEPVNNGDKGVITLTTGSLSGLLSGLAAQSGFTSQQIPTYLNLNSTLSNLTNNDSDLYNVVDSLFGTHTNVSLFGEDLLEKRNIKFGGLNGLPGYIFQLGSVTSRADVTGLSSRDKVKNNYLNSFCLDVGHDNNGEVKVLTEDAPEEILDSNITCFTVDFGKENQQMFNSVQLDTSEFYDTEESIKTWVDLINQAGTTPQTKNIFPVLEKRSYTCTVTSLGNATIQPLTYFYLRNVPLFHGTYWITNVTHKIIPNNMVTTFKGVRQPIISKNDVRKELLELMRQQKAEILKTVNANDQIVIEGEPDTSGRLQVVENSGKPYGEIAQDLKPHSGQIHYFDGMAIIGRYIFSITGSNEVSAANLGIIATLYNTAKSFKNNTADHPQIIKTMPIIAVGLMKDTGIGYNDERYIDGDNEFSLSKLFKVSSSGFNPNGNLANFLNDEDFIKSYSGYGTKMVLPASVDVFDLVGSIKGVDTGLVDGNGKVTLSAAAKITVMDKDSKELKSETIPIKETTFFIDHKLTTYDNGITAEVNFDATGSYDLYDVFNSFDKVNKKTINSLNSEIDLIGVMPETKTALATKSNLPALETFRVWCDYIDLISKYEKVSDYNVLRDIFWKFALTESNGSKTKNDLLLFVKPVFDNLTVKLTKDQIDVYINYAWSLIPKVVSGNSDVAVRAIFNGISEITFEKLAPNDPSGFDNFELTYPVKFPDPSDNNNENFVRSYGGLYKDIDNQNSFYADANEVIRRINATQATLVKEKTKANATEQIKIKFLGTYSNVSFFTTKHSGSNYGQINWSPLGLNSFYSLGTTTQPDSIGSKSGIDINKQNSYLSKIGDVIDEEYKLWESGALKEDCKNPIVIGALTKYWIAARSSIAKFPCGSPDSPWSAAFISFIMQKSGVEFPFSINHNTYILKSRDNKDYTWQAYDVSDPNATVRAGDLVCNTRGKSINKTLSEIAGGDLTHCDCIKEATTAKAYAYGGNVSQTVLRREINLIDGSGLIDPSNNKGDGSRVSDLKYICVIKYQPKGTEVATTGGANNFDPNATGAFTANQKYPALFEKVLSHESHTYDDHNWYTTGDVLHSCLADVSKTRYGGLAKPLSQYTIGEVIQFQSHAEDSVGRLHATGRYQIIGTTLKGNLKEAGLTNTDLYSPENQDKLGMVLLQTNTIKYLNKQVDDTQDNLNKAAMEIARTWSSVGVPHPTTWTDDKGRTHNVAFDESYYGGNGVDRAATKTADVQAALKYYRNGSITSVASNVTSKTVVIGDSLSQGINSVYPAISRISSPKVLDTVGWRLSQLTTALTGTNTTFPDVKNLILTIGANDGWNLSSGNAKEIELIGLIQQKFPNATKYITNGNYGWGGIAVKPACDATCWVNKINNYINVYKNSGFTVVGNVSLCTVHPGKGDALFTSFNPVLSKLA